MLTCLAGTPRGGAPGLPNAAVHVEGEQKPECACERQRVSSMRKESPVDEYTDTAKNKSRKANP